MMVPIGSLLDTMADVRNRLFPELVRERADGTTYLKCVDCNDPAVDPQLHCERHLTTAKLMQARKLEALDQEGAADRKARRRREAIEAHAHRLACNIGKPDKWRAFLKQATAIIDGPTVKAAAKAEVDDVF